MTENETLKLMLLIKAEYQRESAETNETTTKLQAQLWFKMLNEFDFNLVLNSFQKHISSSEGMYKPSIHHLLKNINALTNGETKTHGEAWEEVMKNVRKFGLYNQADGLNNLDTFTRKIVEQIGYKEICLSENIDIIRAQFRKAYESTEKREKEFNNMPSHLKQLQIQANNKKGIQSIKQLLSNFGGV